jgi:hypothetical protein
MSGSPLVSTAAPRAASNAATRSSTCAALVAGVFACGGGFGEFVEEARAGELEDRQWRIRPYVGGAIGPSSDGGTYAFTNATTRVTESSGVGIKAYAGAMFGRYFGIEIGAARLASTSVELTDTTTGAVTTATFDHDAVPLSFVGALPIGERFELLGRAGMVINSSYATDDICYRRTSRYGSTRTRCVETPFTWGIGARWAMNEHLGVRFDYDFIELRDS